MIKIVGDLQRFYVSEDGLFKVMFLLGFQRRHHCIILCCQLLVTVDFVMHLVSVGILLVHLAEREFVCLHFLILRSGNIGVNTKVDRRRVQVFIITFSIALILALSSFPEARKAASCSSAYSASVCRAEPKSRLLLVFLSAAFK